MMNNNTTPTPKPIPPWMKSIFGSRNVFVFYAVCLVITVGTMIASIIISLVPEVNTVEKMVEHVMLCAGALILLSVPLIMHRRYDFRIPWPISITIAFMILAHFVLGEIYRFYDNVYLYDKFLHLTGGFVIGACGFSIVYGFSENDDGGSIKLSPFFTGLFSFCFALALLVLWEVLEYIIDSAGGYNMQRWKDGLAIAETIGGSAIKPKVEYVMTEIDSLTHWLSSARRGSGLIDTMNDLIIGSIGAAVVSIMGAMSFKNNPHNKTFLIVRKKSAGAGSGK